LARLQVTDFPKVTRFFGRFMVKPVDLYLTYSIF
jgi:hypothetical protein